ncbi:hypothetical protein BJ912DRAFT_1086186 [Pholiota molesta]|nr:hypothetical protein BJ912DRAFT_1086186 [Pholiota molesta]
MALRWVCRKLPSKGHVGTLADMQFTLTSAEQGGVYILNVEEGLTVATLAESVGHSRNSMLHPTTRKLHIPERVLYWEARAPRRRDRAYQRWLCSQAGSGESSPAREMTGRAEEGGFHVLSVKEGLTVATLVESNLTLPEAAFTAPPSTYAIECVGNGEFVIKVVDEDLVWTAVPETREGDEQQGAATVEMLPADGSGDRRFLLNAL